MITRETIDKLKFLASRYPSPHNVQPAVWKIEPEGNVTLFADESRRLFVGDPGCRDHQISLGAAWECLKIAAGRFDFELEEFPLTYTAQPHVRGGIRQVICGKLIKRTEPVDVLCNQLERRRCYRGQFKGKLDPMSFSSIEALGWKLLTTSGGIFEVAKLYDQSTVAFMRSDGFAEELYDWLRLRRSHRNYLKDGLNREAMSLSPLEGFIADILMRPRVVNLLDKLWLLAKIVTESPQINSSSAIAVWIVEGDEVPFNSGRKLIRAWLLMTEFDIYGCPLSSVTDNPVTCGILKGLLGLDDKASLVMALRIGPTASPYLCPRL